MERDIPQESKVFTPGNIGNLKLRNRIIRAGCFEGMCQQGSCSEELIEHHRAVARGGAAMTTVAAGGAAPDKGRQQKQASTSHCR